MSLADSTLPAGETTRSRENGAAELARLRAQLERAEAELAAARAGEERWRRAAAGASRCTWRFVPGIAVREDDLAAQWWTALTGHPVPAGLEAALATVHADDRAGLRAAIDVLATRGAAMRAEFRVAACGGGWRWVCATGARASGADGGEVAYVGTLEDVTERRQSGSELREFASRLQFVTDHVPVLIAHVDAGERFKFANAPFASSCGVAACEVIGRPVGEIVGDTVYASLRGPLATALAGTRTEFELRLPFTVLGARWMHGVFVPELEPSGAVCGVIGVMEDTTDRRAALERLRAEERLRREQHAELEAIYNTAPIGLALIGRDLRFRRINARLAEINGFPPDEHIGRTVTELLPDLAGQAAQVIGRVLTSGETLDVEIVGETPAKPGVRRIWDEHLFPVRLSGEEFDAVGVVAMEVTDQRRAEENLREREASLREAQRLAQLGSWSWIAATDVLHGSDEFFRIFGAQPGEGRLHFRRGPLRAPGAIFPRESWAELEAALDRTLDEGTPFELDLPACRTGAGIWVTVRGEVVRDAAGHATGVRGTMQDVTERRKAAEELRRAKEEAERANRAKDHFLAMLSHELRTPLTPVLMCAHLRRSDVELPPHVREDFAMIERNIRLEARLIDDLLDVTRLARGLLALDLELCDVHLLIRYAVETVAEAVREKDVNIRQHLRATASHLRADPSRLQQVLWNLLSNAVKFVPAGGEVTIATRNDGDSVIVEVQDNGAGFPPEAANRIFQPFEQAAQVAAGQSAGLGLGLAIARGVVDLHGGTMRAASEGPGKGATFTVELPGAQPGPRAAEAPAPPVADAAAGARPLRVLVVEDHAPTLRVLSSLLQRGGYQYLTATTVSGALRAAEGREIDVLVCDIGLPDGTGMDVMRHLRSTHPGLAGVAVSGFGMEEDIARSRAAGFAVHLIKPVDFRLLEEAIRRVAAKLPAA